MNASRVAPVESARTRPGNPFPGLRPFEPQESSLFFGRDEQCDDLLARLARRRLVAVVGMSGSGKSSLVRAGLLPALDRGYLPSAGSSWHIAIFRPGSDPVANLARSLVTRRRPGGQSVEDPPDRIRALLDNSSLGLVAAGRQILDEAPDAGDSLLIVADQFEEIFRFSRLASTDVAHAQAAACVDLLVNAAQQDEVPIYVVLTMRSDYLGDCANFTGLPEALNDSQFLVPRMTRAQLRAAIESPVAVGGARITPRLAQRLLYEVDDVSSGEPATPRGATPPRHGQDQLPVLQHALMRVWEVSRAARDRGEPIDVPDYERPPVETLRHALDRHAEEVYQALPSDAHRDVARRVFQQLTDRDAENREVRRPTALRELTAVALHTAPDRVTPSQAAIVHKVIDAFAAEGRAFVVVNAQQDVDISHESFIRKWERLRGWVEAENRSRRIYSKLADAASLWEKGEASLYRGPELVEARRWWQQEQPTALWASRYDPRFEVAERFLQKSVIRRRLRRGLLFGNIALLVVSAVAVAVLMSVSRQQAKRAEAAALEARNLTETSKREIAKANALITQALEAQRRGQSAQADALAKQAQQMQSQADSRPVLTPGELAELDRLRKQESAHQQTEADLKRQLAAASSGSTAAAAASREAELASARDEATRTARAAVDSDRAALQQQLTAAADRANRSQQSEAALKKANDDLQLRIADLQKRLAESPGATVARAPDATGIKPVLDQYKAAYEALDAAAVAMVMPSASLPDLARSFTQLRSYAMDLGDPQIVMTSGTTALAVCLRKIVAEPKVGTAQRPPAIATLFRVRRPSASAAWVIESVTELK